MITIWTILVMLAVVGWLIYLFNTLVGLSNRVDAVWADIDAQLKRRYDLAGQLIALARGSDIAGAEQLAAACAAGTGAYTPSEKSRTEPAMTAALQSILKAAAAHPRLSADENFSGLQNTFQDIEDYLREAGRQYNALAQDLNDQAETFPNSFAASLLGISTRELVQLEPGQPAASPSELPA